MDYETEDKVKVASISLAYDNKDLIDILKSRGQNLVNGRYEKLRKNEQKINKLVKKNKEKYKRPVFAFVIWNCQEGYERCIKFLRTKKSFFGKPVYNKR